MNTETITIGRKTKKINIKSLILWLMLILMLCFGIVTTADYFYNDFSRRNNDKKEQKQKSETGKNDKHYNQNRKQTAKQKYDQAKKEYDELYKKTNKTKEDKKLLKRLKDQVNHWQRKMQETGETHGIKGKQGKH